MAFVVGVFDTLLMFPKLKKDRCKLFGIIMIIYSWDKKPLEIICGFVRYLNLEILLLAILNNF